MCLKDARAKYCAPMLGLPSHATHFTVRLVHSRPPPWEPAHGAKHDFARPRKAAKIWTFEHAIKHRGRGLERQSPRNGK